MRTKRTQRALVLAGVVVLATVGMVIAYRTGADSAQPVAVATATTVSPSTTTTAAPTTTTESPPETTTPPAPPITINPAALAATSERALQAVTSAERAVRSYELVVQQYADRIPEDEAALAEAQLIYGTHSQEAVDARQQLDYDRKRLDNVQHDLADARALLERARDFAREVG